MKELCLDLSHWDGDIDLQAWIDKHNLWGVIIKAGGNETSLGRYKDPKFERHYKLAKSLGLHIGFYYYTVSTDISNAKTDANHFADLISGHDWDLPCYMDAEDSRQFALSRRTLTDVIKAFCDTLISRGYYAGLYTSGSAWLNNMYADELRDYANWIAWWRAAWPSEAGDIGMWQQGTMRYSDGKIFYDDVSGCNDLDWCVIDYPTRIKNGWKKQQDETNTSSEIQNGSNKKEEVVSSKGTADEVIRVAESQLGYYAPDDPERGSKYGRWMAELLGEDWLAGPSTEIWWCCMFVSWCLNQAGVVVKGFPTYNTDLAISGGAKNYLISNKSQIKCGDILIFDWNWATAATDHIGFAKASPSDSYVSTIEGNVGNAVQNKTRPLSSIRYVVRPQYAGSVTPVSTSDTPKNNKNGGKLDVDGSAGYNTILDWQDQLGTPCDGEISGQHYSSRKYFPGVSAVTWEGTGSMLVKAIQQKVGVYADGIWGPATSKGIQNWLLAKGYSVGSCGADGYFGTDSVKALQKSLNDKAWK